MFGIRKMSPLLLRTNLPLTFTIYDIQALRNLSEDFQENILGEAILVYNRSSQQPVCNLTKRRTPPPVFFGETFEDGWLWTAASEQPKRKISKKTFLVASFQYIIATLSSQSVILQKEGLYNKEIFKNGCLLTFSYATRNVDCIPQIKIKHNLFKNNFFLSAIIEQNKLDPVIRNAESLGIFKINTLKFFRATPRSFFDFYKHKGIRPLGECEHKFNHNFQNCIDPLIEALFDDKRITLLRTLNKVDCKLVEAMESSLIKMLLFGNSLFDLKKKLPHSFLCIH